MVLGNLRNVYQPIDTGEKFHESPEIGQADYFPFNHVPDLELLTNEQDLSKAIFLFHSPPYKTYLDRAALDNVLIDHVPADVHVGSIAIKEFIKKRKPYITLHGHIHESSRITGHWKQKLNKTWAFSAAYEKSQLAVVEFRLEEPEKAVRVII